MLYGKVNVPSRVTVSRDVQNIVDETTARLIDRFEVRAIAITNMLQRQTHELTTESQGQDPLVCRWVAGSERNVLPRRHSSLA